MLPPRPRFLLFPYTTLFRSNTASPFFIFGPPGICTTNLWIHCSLKSRLSSKVVFSRSEEHTSELQSPCNLVCRLLLEKKNEKKRKQARHGQGIFTVASFPHR